VTPASLAIRRKSCGVAYVELGSAPALDQVLVCARPFCTVHPRQLDWVEQDPGRVAAYVELVGLVDGSVLQVEQGALL